MISQISVVDVAFQMKLFLVETRTEKNEGKTENSSGESNFPPENLFIIQVPSDKKALTRCYSTSAGCFLLSRRLT